MAIVSHTLGSSVIAQAEENPFSLMGNMFTVTPDNFQSNLFMKFSDMAFAPSGTGNSVLSSFSVPAIIHAVPSNKDMPDLIEDPQSPRSAVGKANPSFFGSGLVNDLWPTQSGKSPTDRIKVVLTEEAALDWCSDETSALCNVAVMSTDKEVRVFYNDRLIEQIVRKLRDKIEVMGAWSPKLAWVGMGHVNEDGSTQRPSFGFEAGDTFWHTKRYQVQGTVRIPTDVIAYNKLKRLGGQWHLWYQVAWAWINGMSENKFVEQAKFKSGDSGRNSVLWAGLTMLAAARAGTTTSPEPFDGPLDAATVIERVKTRLISDFGSQMTHLDLHQSNWDNKNVKQFWLNHIVFETVSAALLDKLAVPLYPAQLEYVAGPSDKAVVNLAANFRGDYNFGDSPSDDLPFTLLPTKIGLGYKCTRLPMLFGAKETTPNSYRGPKDPIVISNLMTETYKGEMPETIIEDDMYMSTPVYRSDALMLRTYRSYRYYNVMALPRPTYTVANTTDIYHLYNMMSNKQPLKGPQFSQPMGSIFITKFTPKGKPIIKAAGQGAKQASHRAKQAKAISAEATVFDAPGKPKATKASPGIKAIADTKPGYMTELPAPTATPKLPVIDRDDPTLI